MSAHPLDDELIGRDGVDQPVLLIDLAGPEAGEVATEPLGLTRAAARFAGGFLDQSVDAL